MPLCRKTFPALLGAIANVTRAARQSRSAMKETLVRSARASDASDIARLSAQLGYPALAEEIPERLARLSGDPAVSAMVAEVDGRVSGLLTIHLRYTLNHHTPLAQITMLVVDEGVRGTGVGRALVTHAEQWARERDCRRVVVTTQLSRAGAHAFYETIGYTHTGRRYGKDFA
jgi:GNAT superfamily N-acetyltransferase